MKSHAHAHELHDTEQSVWELSAIQLSGWTSLPILATSLLILQQNSFYGSIMTIIVGNAILWFIRLGIILMTYKKRKSTLDISRDYLGNFGSYFIGTLLILATLAWFIAQTTAASNTLTQLIAIEEHPSINKFVQMSVLLGILSTFLCMEGIVALKKLATWTFPFLLAAFVVILVTVPFKLPPQNNAALSLAGLSLVLGSSLGITSDMPTFFRHSKSLTSSIIALTIVQVMSLALAIASLFFGAIISNSFEVNSAAVLSASNLLLRIALIVFLFLSAICANVANVYSASVGWEVIAPKSLVGRKEYLILGLGLTTIFIMIPNALSAKFLVVALEATDTSLVNLCIILIIGYILNRQTEHQPNAFHQRVNFTAWLLSTLVTTFLYLQHTPMALSPLTVGFIIVLLTILTSFVVRRIIRWCF